MIMYNTYNRPDMYKKMHVNYCLDQRIPEAGNTFSLLSVISTLS